MRSPGAPGRTGGSSRPGGVWFPVVDEGVAQPVHADGVDAVAVEVAGERLITRDPERVAEVGEPGAERVPARRPSPHSAGRWQRCRTPSPSQSPASGMSPGSPVKELRLGEALLRWCSLGRRTQSGRPIHGGSLDPVTVPVAHQRHVLRDAEVEPVGDSAENGRPVEAGSGIDIGGNNATLGSSLGDDEMLVGADGLRRRECGARSGGGMKSTQRCRSRRPIRSADRRRPRSRGGASG